MNCWEVQAVDFYVTCMSVHSRSGVHVSCMACISSSPGLAIALMAVMAGHSCVPPVTYLGPFTDISRLISPMQMTSWTNTFDTERLHSPMGA